MNDIWSLKTRWWPDLNSNTSEHSILRPHLSNSRLSPSPINFDREKLGCWIGHENIIVLGLHKFVIYRDENQNHLVVCCFCRKIYKWISLNKDHIASKKIERNPNRRYTQNLEQKSSHLPSCWDYLRTIEWSSSLCWSDTWK